MLNGKLFNLKLGCLSSKIPSKILIYRPSGDVKNKPPASAGEGLDMKV